MKPRSPLSYLARQFRALPTGFKVVLGVAVVAGVGVASVLMYEAYDYVQHDNQFCLECHLMQDPFERFAQSAHRDLGCKACHRPNIIQRSEMGLAQVIVNPDSIRVHADVPNEICAECHIEGDPDRWRLVANTAGHRIHLESDDPALEGLNCVECHSSGVHQFTPTDLTCGQGGCHEDTEIRLGRMANLTIHCATCHDFAAPVEPAVSDTELATSLRPEAAECMSCHQMRSMLSDMPADEPHDAECGACHDPHTQTSPAQAVESCATAGCHASPDTLTAFHRGLDTGVLENCTSCHRAHDFRLHGAEQACLDCHRDIYEDAPASTISGITHPVRLASSGPPQAQEGVRFWHSQHRDVECTACHSMEQTHGGLTVSSLRDCRSCHHTEPVATDCLACHTRADVRRVTARVPRTLDIRVGRLDRPSRRLPFEHAVHLDLDCARCHTDGLRLSASTVACSGCHDQHHEPTSNCMACHERPADGAHTVDVHLGCAGSGCHEALPTALRDVPRTRDFCMACHQDLTDHRPGRNCEDCHTLPRSRQSAAQSGPGPHPADP